MLRVEGLHKLRVRQTVLGLEVRAVVEDGAVPLKVVKVRGRVGDVGHASHDPLWRFQNDLLRLESRGFNLYDIWSRSFISAYMQCVHSYLVDVGTGLGASLSDEEVHAEVELVSPERDGPCDVLADDLYGTCRF